MVYKFVSLFLAFAMLSGCAFKKTNLAELNAVKAELENCAKDSAGLQALIEDYKKMFLMQKDILESLAASESKK